MRLASPSNLTAFVITMSILIKPFPGYFQLYACGFFARSLPLEQMYKHCFLNLFIIIFFKKNPFILFPLEYGLEKKCPQQEWILLPSSPLE